VDRGRMNSRICRALLLVPVLSLGGNGLVLRAWAQENAAPENAAPENAAQASPATQPAVKVPGSIPGQEGDDLVEPLVPAKPRTAAEQARVDALAWFGTARVLQGRGDLQGAFDAYRKSVEQDPNIIAVYRQLIPLALHLNQPEVALQAVQRASELAPNDYEWLVQLAELQIRSENLGGAINSLEKATRLPSLDPKSTAFIVLKNQLGQWYLATQRFVDASRVLEPVFAAVLDPAPYKLTPQLRNQILANISFEKFGEVFLQGGKPALALDALNRAVEKRGSKNGDLSFLLALAQYEKGDATQALAELQGYLDNNRQSKRQGAYDLLASVLEKLGQKNEFLPRLEAAAMKDARNPYLQLALAEQYVEGNRLDEAEALFKKTLGVSADARGYAGLAGVYRRRGKPGELLSALASSYGEAGTPRLIEKELKALVSDPALANSVLQVGQDQLRSEPGKLKFPQGYVLAQLAVESKKTDLVVEFYRHLLRIRNERGPQLYEELGQHLLDARRYQQAAEIYGEAAKAVGFQERGQFEYSQAFALTMAGKADDGLNLIRRLVNDNDRNPAYQFREAWILGHARRFDDSIQAYQQLLRRYPESPQIQRLGRSGLSNVFVSKGDLKKGEEVLEEVFRESPDDISVNNDLGYLYADQGKNLEQAEQMIRKAVEAEPDNGAYLDSLGWVLHRLGKDSEALPLIQKSVEKGQGSGDETLHEHLGDVLEKLDRSEEALGAWKKARQLAGENPYPDPALIQRLDEKLRGRDQGRKLPPIDDKAP
jgi:tetratricopeptide (TPR) repeat protein